VPERFSWLALGIWRMLILPVMTWGEKLRKLLDLQAGESKPVLAMTAYFMLLIFAFLIGRTVRDALFLAEFGMDYLPWMYVGTALSVSLSSQVYTRIAPRINPRIVGYVTVVAFAAVFALFRFIVQGNGNLFTYGALYLWVEVFGGLALLEFWNLAGEVFDSRQAKRLYGLISAGQVFSNLLCGALSSLLSARWGAENLLWLASGSLIVLLPLLAWVGAYRTGKRTAKKAPPKIDTSDPAYLKHVGYLQTIAAVVAITFLSTSVIDFQFKLAAKAAFPGKDELAKYFGIFYASVGTVGFFLQTFFTGRITKALGVLETLAIMPLFFLLGSLGQVFAPGLATATGTKFFENTLRYSVNDPVTQLLYLPLPSNLRLRALALASGTIKPWAMGGAGLLMLAVKPFAGTWPSAFSWIVFFLCTAWLALLIRLKRGYLGAVASGAEEARRLVWTRPRLDPNDPLVKETLLRTLREANPERIDYALTLAERVDIDGLEACLRECLQKSGTGRARVLKTLEARRDTGFLPDIRSCATPEELPATYAAALRALAALEGEKALPQLRKALHHESPVVRAGALEALVNYCGTKGLSITMGTLDYMLAASDPAVRVLAIRVIAHTSIPHPFQLLESVLDDPDREVAREAIRALGVRCDEEAVEPLLNALGNSSTATAAAEAISRFGDSVVDGLTNYLLAGNDSVVREAALKALSMNAAQRAGEVLATKLPELPWGLRIHAASALQKKLRQGVWSPSDGAKETLMRAALQQMRQTAWFKLVAEQEQAHAVMATALQEKVLAAELQSMRLCTLLWPQEELLVLSRAAVLADPYKRQLLTEICDNLIGGELKDVWIPYLEGNDRAAIRNAAGKFAPLPDDPLDVLVHGEDGWLRACALWTAVSLGRFEIYNETPGAKVMTDLVEKVLLLKSATLFQHLSGADIEKIAAIAQECSFAEGQPIFELGDPGDALYIVTRGQVKIHIGDKQLAVLKERDCFGEMAILDDQPRSASVTALSGVDCLSLRRDDFFFLLEDHFEIVKSIIRVLTERIRNSNQAQAAPPPPPPAAAQEQ
jgi:ATP/ADP translocase